MDNIHYDKIADKLIQFRSKIPQYNQLSGSLAKNWTDQLKKQIDELLKTVDMVAEMDNRGLIR